MAELVFTDTALLHIRAVIATSPIVQPVVSVVWSKGTIDNTRSADGKVNWKTVEEPNWFAFIADWHDLVDVPSHDNLLEIHGLSLYLDERAKTVAGKFLISLTERGLAVEHTAS